MLPFQSPLELLTLLAMILRQAQEDITHALHCGLLDAATLALTPAAHLPQAEAIVQQGRGGSDTLLLPCELQSAVRLLTGQDGARLCDLVNQITGRAVLSPALLLTHARRDAARPGWREGDPTVRRLRADRRAELDRLQTIRQRAGDTSRAGIQGHARRHAVTL